MYLFFRFSLITAYHLPPFLETPIMVDTGPAASAFPGLRCLYCFSAALTTGSSVLASSFATFLRSRFFGTCTTFLGTRTASFSSSVREASGAAVYAHVHVGRSVAGSLDGVAICWGTQDGCASVLATESKGSGCGDGNTP